MQTRNTTTKADIKRTFIHLLKTKGLDAITVSDISRGAEINRGTFYLHYLDKYDLLEKLEMETIYDLKQILLIEEATENDDPADLIPYDLILKALEYLKADFEFISALAAKGGDPHFSGLVKEVMGEMLTAKISQAKNLHFTKKDLPEDYATEIMLSGVVSIIMLWIRKGAPESPQEIAQMIDRAKQIAPCELLV